MFRSFLSLLYPSIDLSASLLALYCNSSLIPTRLKPFSLALTRPFQGFILHFYPVYRFPLHNTGFRDMGLSVTVHFPKDGARKPPCSFGNGCMANLQTRIGVRHTVSMFAHFETFQNYCWWLLFYAWRMPLKTFVCRIAIVLFFPSATWGALLFGSDPLSISFHYITISPCFYQRYHTYKQQKVVLTTDQFFLR